MHQNPNDCKFCQKCGNKLILRERFIPREILGEGGFGRTFLATDTGKPSQPTCVIKQFLPQAQGTDTIEKASRLFNQEAKQLEQLGQHPQIPELLDYFIHTEDNRQYLVQEYVEGDCAALPTGDRKGLATWRLSVGETGNQFWVSKRKSV